MQDQEEITPGDDPFGMNDFDISHIPLEGVGITPRDPTPREEKLPEPVEEPLPIQNIVKFAAPLKKEITGH